MIETNPRSLSGATPNRLDKYRCPCGYYCRTKVNILIHKRKCSYMASNQSYTPSNHSPRNDIGDVGGHPKDIHS